MLRPGLVARDEGVVPPPAAPPVPEQHEGRRAGVDPAQEAALRAVERAVEEVGREAEPPQPVAQLRPGEPAAAPRERGEARALGLGEGHAVEGEQGRRRRQPALVQLLLPHDLDVEQHGPRRDRAGLAAEGRLRAGGERRAQGREDRQAHARRS